MKRISFFIAISIIAGALVTGCSKRRTAAPDVPVTDEFGVSVQDVDVDTSANISGLRPLLSPAANGHFDLPSAQWQDTARRLFEAASSLRRDDPATADRVLKMAHHVTDGFYALPYGATPMTSSVEPAGNPFSEEAWSLVQPTLVQKYNEVMDSCDSKVDLAIAKARLSLPAPKTEMSLEKAMKVPVDVLETFLTALKALDRGDITEVVSGIDEKLRKDYIGELKHLGEIVKKQTSAETASSYLNRLKDALSTTSLIAADDKPGILKKLNPVTEYASKVDSLQSDKQTMKTLIDVWLAKDERAKFPPNVRDHVTSTYKGHSTHEIIAFVEDNENKNLDPKAYEAATAARDQFIQTLAGDAATATYAQQLSDDPLPDAEPARSRRIALVITSHWFNLDLREGFPELSALNRFSEEELEKIRDDDVFFLTHPILTLAHGKIQSTLANFDKNDFPDAEAFPKGFLRFKAFLNFAIIEAIQKQIGAAVVDVAQALPDKVRDGIHASIKDLRNQVATNTFELYKKFSSTYLDKWFFAGQSLPLIEKRNLRLGVSGGHLVNFNLPSETSAELLGLTLTNAVHRMNTLGAVGVTADSQQARAIAFATICKLQALMGYKGIDGQPVPSLMASLFMKHPDQNIDLANYDSKNPFAVPDVAPLMSSYKFDGSLAKKNTSLTIAGQMELLTGLTDTMNFLKPWDQSTFDESLGPLHIDEIPGQALFPKETFFLQSLGLAATVLQNLPAYMLGVVTLDSALVPLSEVKDKKDINVIGAVVADANKTGLSHVIKTRDMALALLALRHFMMAIDDLDKSSSPDIRKAAKQFKTQKETLAQLFLGMSMFSASHLELSDGGFAESYDMDKHTPSTGPRNLSDQLLMQRAMMVSGDYLEKDFIRLRAVENFFFLNSHFWNAKLGFYNRLENDKSPRLALREVAMAVANAAMMKSMVSRVDKTNFDVDKTIDQLRVLESKWAARFFSDVTLDLPALYQVSEFGL